MAATESTAAKRRHRVDTSSTAVKTILEMKEAFLEIFYFFKIL